MNRQSTQERFDRELKLFLAKNNREISEFLMVLLDLNTRSIFINLENNFLELIIIFLEAYDEKFSSKPETRKDYTLDLPSINKDEFSAEKGADKRLNERKSENLWQEQPISDEQPEKHSENHFKIISINDNLQLLGARVRGKSHKHHGTNCDDWFEFKCSGKWQIIAIADGAGSKTFSRLGAKISCEAAVEKLALLLENHQLSPRRDREELQQNDGDIDQVYRFISEAIAYAYEAVENRAKELHNHVDYYLALNNCKLELSDLAATLLIAVQTTISIDNREYSFVFSHQIGDGVIAAISQQNSLYILGNPDTGSYAGQTEFLTSKNKTDAELIRANTKTFIGNLKVLMLMSDGVSDDYFPFSSKLLNLYGDLVLNQIIPSSILKSDLFQKQIKEREKITGKYSEFCVGYPFKKAQTNEELEELQVAYFDQYAKLFEMSERELISADLLALGAIDNPVADFYKSMENISPAEKLQNWLDTYYRRGSFDDRTLVILHHQ